MVFVRFVQQRGKAVIDARGASSAASAANAVIDTVKAVDNETKKGDWFSAAIASDGSYDIPQGLIFGFPLRLLARENYDKAVKRLGLNSVALITGEEKILPKEARFYFCTVESMPKNIYTECVIIDEIQLAADYERGHIFTDHILNNRGYFETIFLGSLTITESEK